MTDTSRFDHYRSLFAQIGEEPARSLIDRLQVLALTDPGTVREMEKFIGSGGTLGRPLSVHPAADRRQLQDRRKVSMTVAMERRIGPRRVNELANR